MSEKCRPCIISDANLNVSVAWAKAFLASIYPTRTHLTPLILRIEDFSDDNIQEDETIRTALDRHLQHSCHTVANTIFPWSLWNCTINRDALYQRYQRILPLIRKCRANTNGVYFERLIAYGNGETKINQLEHIIQTYNQGNHRPSALQASIFDPTIDHTNQRQRGFPCLQQIIITQLENKGLSITGIYASQYLFERAYGNYLGLCRLGQFIAHELGLKLVQMNCYIGKALLEVRNSQIQILISTVISRLKELGHDI